MYLFQFVFSLILRLVNNAAVPPIDANSPARSSGATLAEPANQAPTAPAASWSSPGEFFISFFLPLTDC